MNLVRFLLLTALLVFFGEAQARLIQTASTLNDDAIFYVFDDSINLVNKDTRQVWEIVNYPNNLDYGYKSIKAHQEYDCQLKRVRTLHLSIHSELFAKGKTLKVASGTPLDWKLIPDSAVANHTRHYVCSKR